MSGPAQAAPGTDTVLLVDDNPANLQVLYQTLEGSDLRLLVARGGEQALSIAERVHPALVLLDIMMRDMDGYEVCRRIKAHPEIGDTAVIFLDVMMPDMGGDEVAARLQEDPELKHIKFVFLTAIVTKEETGEGASEISGHTFLAKPVKADELVSCIERFTDP